MTNLRLVVASLFLCVSSQVLAGQAQPVPAKTESGYRIGPYPIQIEYEGVPGIIYTWLFFHAVPIGRGNATSYSLYLTIKMQLNTLPALFQLSMSQKYPSDNCARLNNVDNWVYSFDVPRLYVSDEKHLRIDAYGQVSTWTCLENPVFETVCETYRDDIGLTWPKNCKTRRGDPAKSQNFQQGVNVSKSFYLNAKDGRVYFKDLKPYVHFTGGPADVLTNSIAMVTNNIGAAFSSSFMSAQTITMVVPEMYRAFHPNYHIARFEMNRDVPFLVVGAEVSIGAKDVNRLMRHTFGALYEDLPEVEQLVLPSQLTKTQVQAQCRQFAPPDMDVRVCAAKLGLPYDNLSE